MASDSDQLKFEERAELALQLHRSGNFGEAEKRYLLLLEESPDHPIILNLLGSLACQKGEFEKAESTLEKVIVLAPEFAEAHDTLGTTKKKLGKVEEAIASHENAITLQPDFIEAHCNLGIAYSGSSQFEEAIQCFQRAIKINQNFGGAYYNLGNTYFAMGLPHLATKQFLKTIEIQPNNYMAYNGLGSSFIERAMYIEAKDSLEELTKINPDFAPAYTKIGLSLVALGKKSEALAYFDKASEIDSKDAGPWFIRHLCHYQNTELNLALECVDNAVKIEPNNIKYQFFLGMLLDYADNPKLAQKYFDDIPKDDEKISFYLDSWDYIKSVLSDNTLIFGSTPEGLSLALNASELDGLILEFGVRNGSSLRYIADQAEQEVHGFDSFEGLPEAWGDEPAGSYTTEGELPEVPDNVSLHVGWFDETIPPFLENHSGPVRCMNIDCDIYSSTKSILSLLVDRIIPGTVIVFDEYVANPTWLEDEFKAFKEAVDLNGWEYEYLGFSLNSKQSVIRIK
jgi:tetratricopeptide (TPR) repeat protein